MDVLVSSSQNIYSENLKPRLKQKRNSPPPEIMIVFLLEVTLEQTEQYPDMKKLLEGKHEDT